MKIPIVILLTAILPFLTMAGSTLQKNTEWKGEILVDKEIEIPPGKKLIVCKDAKIKFAGNGKIICDGTFKAKDAFFCAENLTPGRTALFFNKANVFLEGCQFKDLPPGERQYKAALEAVYGSFTMKNCEFINCATVQVLHNGGAVIEKNYFKDSVKLALHIYVCRAALVKDNVFDAGPKTQEQLLLTGAEKSRIVSNLFYGKAYDITVRYKSHDNIISENFMCEPKIGIHAYNGNWNNQYVCNLVVKPQYTGFNFKSGKNATVLNCVCWGAGHNGLYAGEWNRLKVMNSVFSNGARGIAISPKASKYDIKNNILWANKKDKKDFINKLKANGNLETDPLFASPERCNFRPQMKAFGYPENSPLFTAKTPIGIYPGLKSGN